MSRPPQTKHTYVQTFVHSEIFVLSSCVQKTLCPDFCRFKITFLRSRPKNVRSNIEIFCVHVQNFVGSKTLMSRLLYRHRFLCSWCVQKCVCPEFHAFMSRLIASFIKISCTQNFYNVFISSLEIL